MKLHSILLTISLLISALCFGQNEITPSAKISLITCDVGEDLYATFGHSAILVFDTVAGIDKVYNYGTFDFNTPGFYTKFARGKLNYMLSVSRFKPFIKEYIHLQRSVIEQELNLSFEDKIEIYKFLENNALPENKYYMYDFVYDNCSSRIRDVFKKILGARLKFHDQDQNLSFRQLLYPYIDDKPWVSLGINLVFGMRADKEATTEEYMFLPSWLSNSFQNASVESEKKVKSFTANKTRILEIENPKKKIHFTELPEFLFWALTIVLGIITFIGYRTRKALYFIDFILLFITGFLGIFLTFMWFGTDHIFTANNLNLLWAVPSHFIIAFFLLKKNKPGFLKPYFVINSFLCFGVVIFWSILPQSLPLAILPFVILLGIRSYFILGSLRRAEAK